MDITPRLAEILRDAMAAQGKTILGLATATGIPYATLHRRIHGKAPFTTNELAAVAAELNTTASALFAAVEQTPSAA